MCSDRTLQKHIYDNHAHESPSISNKIGNFQCEIYGKEMKHTKSLVTHKLNAHQPSEDLPCDICKKDIS